MQNRKLAHSALVYMVLGFLPLASSLFLTPVYTHYLSPEEYGLIALANVLQTYLSLLVCFSLDAAFSRFYFNHYQEKEMTNAMLSTTLITILLITCLTGILFSIIGNHLLFLIFGETAFNYGNFGWQILVTSGFGMCYIVVSLYYRDSENLKMFSILAIVYFLLLTGCTFYGVVIANNGAEGSVAGKMVGTVLTMLLFLSFTFYRCGFTFKMEVAREMLKFSYPLFIYGIMAAVFDTMDRFFISHYFDLSVLGQYNFAFVIASVIGIVIASYQSAVNPPIYKMFLDQTNDNSARLNELMKRFIWTGLIFASLCVALAYFAIHYFINPQYHASLSFIPLLALSFIPRAYYIAWSYPLFIENKTKILPVINGISIITGIISNLILIPCIGIYGVTISVILIKSVQAAGALYAVKKLKIYQPLVYRFNEVLIASIVFMVPVIIITLVPYTADIYPLLIPLPFFAVALLFFKDNYPLFKIS